MLVSYLASSASILISTIPEGDCHLRHENDLGFAQASWSTLKDAGKHDNASSEWTVEEEPIVRQSGRKRYKAVNRNYLAEGHDGFGVLKGKPYLVECESTC